MMSKNSSPRSRPKSRKSVKVARPSTPRAEAAPKAPETLGTKIRRLLVFIAVPNIVIALSVAVVCFAIVLLTGSPFAYLPAAIGEGWFLVHGAPVTFDGVTLGFVPLVPIAIVASLIAHRVRATTSARFGVLDLKIILALTLAVPLVITAVAYVMVSDASTDYPVNPPGVIPAFFYPLGVHCAGLILGIAPDMWRTMAQRRGVPRVVVDSAQVASQLFLRLLAGATVVYLVFLVAGWERISHLLTSYPNLSASGVVALIVLSLLYLPNAVFATLITLVGGEVSYAGGTVSLFTVVNVALPPFPLFGAIPGEVPAWAPIFLVVPAAIVARFFLRNRAGATHLSSVGATAGWLAAITLAVALVAGGEAGAYGRIGSHPLAAAGLTGIWVASIGALVWAVNRLRNRSSSPEAPEPDTAHEFEPESEPELQLDDAAGETSPSERPAGGSTKWVPPTSS